MEATYVSTERQTDKEDVAREYNGLPLRHEAEWNAICSTVDGPGDGHAEWRKSEKNKPPMMSSFTELKYDTQELI